MKLYDNGKFLLSFLLINLYYTVVEEIKISLKTHYNRKKLLVSNDWKQCLFVNEIYKICLEGRLQIKTIPKFIF